MKTIVVGKGIQGRKRIKHCGSDLVATVDPHIRSATYKDISDVPILDYDAACVCIPHGDKLGIVSYLAFAGRHVLVEKPLWMGSQKILKTIQTAADKNKCVLYTAYNHRFEPAIMELSRLLNAEKLGKIYSIRIFYGNGTAVHVHESPWRDSGIGIFGEIGSHLLDLAHMLCGSFIWSSEPQLDYCGKNENETPDHIIFSLKLPCYIQLEATYLSWKNSFTIDVIGEKGSAHVNGLIKWGKSTCKWQERVYPSGVPISHEISWSGMDDPTWADEYDYFKRLCNDGNYLHTKTQNDLRINYTINKLVKEFKG